MKTSPLQLDHHFMTVLHLEAGPNAGEQAPVVAASTRAAPDGQNPQKWCVQIIVELNNPEKSIAAYTGRIEFIGYFTVDDKFPKDKVEQLARVNGASILYAAAREMIANITGRGPWRAIQLPSVSFVEDAPKDKVPTHTAESAVAQSAK